MDVFMVEYSDDFGATTKWLLVSAETKSKAYLEAYIILDKEEIITDVFKI